MQSTKVFFRRFSLHLYSGADNQSFIHVEKHVENFFSLHASLGKEKEGRPTRLVVRTYTL